MKLLIISAHIAILNMGGFLAHADETCSLGQAKKFTDAIIAVEVEENNYRPGKLVFKRSESKEYTLDYLNEQIDLLGEDSAQKFIEYKNELVQNPELQIFRLKYKWDADDNNDLGFYYIVKVRAYDRGCALKGILSD